MIISLGAKKHNEYRGKKVKKKAVVLIAFALLVLCQCICFVYWGTQKEGYFVDELYTYGLANDTSGDVFFNAKEDYLYSWHNYGDVIDYLTVEPNSDFVMSLNNVYNNQSKDVHPPFYYFLINRVSSLRPGSYTKWIGISLNMLFFCVTQIFVYLISFKILKKEWLSLVPVTVYGFSLGAVNVVLLIRMYMMLTMFGSIFMYLLISFIEKVMCYDLDDNQMKDKTISVLIGLYIVTCAGMLTQYYFVIYAFFACAITGLLLIIKKHFKALLALASVVLLGLLNAILIFIPMLTHIFYGGRGQESINNISRSGFIFIIRFVTALINAQLFSGCVLVLIAIMVLVLLIRMIRLKGKRHNVLCTESFMYLLMLGITIIGFMIVVCKIIVFVHWRYLAIIYPMIVICFVSILLLVVDGSDFKYSRQLTIISAVLCIVCGGFSSIINKPDFLYTGYDKLFETIDGDYQTKCFYATKGDYSVVYHLDLLTHVNEFYPFIPDKQLNPPVEMRQYATENDAVYLLSDYNYYRSFKSVQVLANKLGYSQCELVYRFDQDAYPSNAKLYKLYR